MTIYEGERQLRKNEKSETNRPAYVKRVGTVRVAVWENQSEDLTFFNTTVSRRFRDGDEWRETNALNGLADITSAMFALEAAARFISLREDERLQKADQTEED